LSFSAMLSAQVVDSIPAAEPKVDIYRVSSGELIFSLADVDLDGESIDPILRFSAFFHFQEIWNFDFSDQFGLQAGLALRNVGFITRDDPIRIMEHQEFIDAGDEVDIKRRSYSFGIPLAFKVGKMKKGGFFFAGAEPELMFHYKEKLFVNGDKDDKYNEWFSDRVNLFNPSVFAGFQFKSGINIKAKYYLNDFLNQDYQEMIDGVPNFPYQNLNTRMFYISIAAGLSPDNGFRDIDLPEDRT
jgi:hypothetical protein